MSDSQSWTATKSEIGSVLSDSLRPHGLFSPWYSPGQITGVGSHALLQGIFPTQGLNRGLPHCRQILYQLSHQGSLWPGGERQTDTQTGDSSSEGSLALSVFNDTPRWLLRPMIGKIRVTQEARQENTGWKWFYPVLKAPGWRDGQVHPRKWVGIHFFSRQSSHLYFIYLKNFC